MIGNLAAMFDPRCHRLAEVKPNKDAPVPTFPTTSNAYQRVYGGGDSDAFALALSSGAMVSITVITC